MFFVNYNNNKIIIRVIKVIIIRVIIKSGIERCPHIIWIGLIFAFNTSFRDCHICLICLHVYNIWIMSLFSLHKLQLLISFNIYNTLNIIH